MHNGRPLTSRKKVQLLLALTILAWATQTLFAQWSRGAEVAGAASSEAFVPRGGGALAGASLELRGEARVFGAEVKLKQVCRWSDADKAMFTPVADLVLVKLDSRRPFRVLEVKDVRQLLEEAGVNVALIRFSGPIECTVSRTDVELKEGEALEQWIKTRDGVSDPEEAETPAIAAALNVHDIVTTKAAAQSSKVDEPAADTLRDLLVANLGIRLSVPQDQLQVSFDPQAESALRLAGPQFKFNIQPRRVRDLGEVSWDVTIVSSAGGGPRKAQITATARAWQNQVVVAKSLARRQVIRAEDVTARRALVDKLPEAALLSAEQVVNQMAARDLKPGTLVTASLVEAVPLAKIGQFITVTLNRGSVRIKSVGKALEGGSYGQTIRVKNESTRDVYQAVLTGPQEASMTSPDAPAGDNGLATAAKN